MTAPAREEATSQPVHARRVGVLALCTVVVLAPYLAGVLVPYYVNDLDAVPLAEVASGMHDPKDLWPQGLVGGLTQLAGFLSIALTPIGLLAVSAVALPGFTSRSRRGTPAVTAGHVLVTALCLAALALFFSPLGNALAAWRMD